MRGGVSVVEDFTHSFDKPGWTGIVGANGSGKTSVLRAIAGRLPIGSGTIILAGRDCSSDRAARAEAIGFAVESQMLPSDLTPREVLGIASGKRDALDDIAIRPLRNALDLDYVLDRRCGTLSAGMKQRIALLAAFLDVPQIVILDEPFNWLDPLTAYDVKNSLRQLITDRGIVLITALHDVTTLTAYCDRGILMNGGRVALLLEKNELRRGLADPLAFEAHIVGQLRRKPSN